MFTFDVMPFAEVKFRALVPASVRYAMQSLATISEISATVCAEAHATATGVPSFTPKMTLAYYDDKLCGVHIYDVVHRTRRLDSVITYVTHAFRKRRVGQMLWMYTLGAHREIQLVRATVISAGGMKLMQSVQKLTPVEVRIKDGTPPWQALRR